MYSRYYLHEVEPKVALGYFNFACLPHAVTERKMALPEILYSCNFKCPRRLDDANTMSNHEVTSKVFT